MSSMEQIDDLIAGYTDLKQYYEGVRDQIDTDLENFTESVSGTIRSHMIYEALVDPELSESDVEARQFRSVAEVIERAAPGALVDISIPAGRTVVIDSFTDVLSMFLQFSKSGSGANPILFIEAYLHPSGNNRLRNFRVRGNPTLLFDEVDIETGPKADDGAGWSTAGSSAIVETESAGGYVTVASRDNTVKVPDGELAFVSGRLGASAGTAMRNVTLDGVTVLRESPGSVYLLSGDGITLENGASFYWEVEAPDGVVESIANITDNT